MQVFALVHTLFFYSFCIITLSFLYTLNRYKINVPFKATGFSMIKESVKHVFTFRNTYKISIGVFML